MARIISIVNQKGGTGKSACTANLAVGLAQKNMKVLIVDADPQSDVSAGFGYRDCDDSNETLTALMDTVMKDEDIPSDCYIRHQKEGIDIICSNIGLAGTEVQLVNAMSREYVLKQILYGIKDQYDAVIIDCMPSLGMITINALAASDEVLIPVEASYLPIKGLQQLLKTIGKVRKQINPKLQVGGILFTMVDAHTNDARNNMELTDEYWINYQKGKGSEEFQKYMEDLTDMQNHVLPYLQSFCNLEEKGVKERREQQIAERYEGRADERVTSTEANEVVKDVGKTDRKPAQQKQAVDGKDKKLSIHERLEINKRIIQEKQGKDKTERGVDLGVRTV